MQDASTRTAQNRMNLSRFLQLRGAAALREHQRDHRNQGDDHGRCSTRIDTDPADIRQQRAGAEGCEGGDRKDDKVVRRLNFGALLNCVCRG